MRQDNPILTIVVPTYCEKDNVEQLVKSLEKALHSINWMAIFVDDNSPDGTADEIRRVAATRNNIQLIVRTGARGLAGACIAGFNSASTKYVGLIDADMQHDETAIPKMLSILEADEADMVVGSRNVTDGSSKGGLSKIRAAGSWLVTAMAKIISPVGITDPMSGYFIMRSEVFAMTAKHLTPQGFKILLDILAAARGKIKVKEVGYSMRSREHGDSKLDATVTLELIALMISIALGGKLPVRFLMFAIVGGTGVMVQLGVVWLSLLYFDGHFQLPSEVNFSISQAIGAAIAMFTNFTLNNYITFRDKTLRGVDFFKGLFSFYVVCAFGFIANIGVATIIYQILPMWVIASVVGVIVGAVWNYFSSSRLIWKHG